MNHSETAQLLGAMAAFDRRTVGDADVIAWQAVLADVAYEDALSAVKRWYSNNTEWIMPAHVRHLVAELVRAREVSPWAPGQYGTPRELAHPELPPDPLRLEDLPEAVRELLARIPAGDRSALHPRRVAWEREHRAYLRTASGEPNQLYVAGNLSDPMPGRDDPAVIGWLAARGWGSYEEWEKRGDE